MKHESVWARSFTRKEQKTIIKRLIPYAMEFKGQFITAIVFALILSLINIALPRSLQYYLDHYLTNSNTTMNMIWAFAGLYFLGTIIKAATQFIQQFSFGMGAERTLERIRVELFKKLHTLGLKYFDNVPAGSIVSRVTNDTKTLFDFWTLFLTIFVASFSVISAFFAMASVSVSLACLTLIFLPVIFATTYLYEKLSSKIYRRLREYLSRINTKLNESLMGISIIQQFRQQKRITHEFEDENEAYMQMRFKMIKINSLLLFPIVTLLFNLAELVTLTYFGVQGLDNFVKAGVIYAFLSYVQNFFNPMTNVMDYMSVFQDGIVAGSRILKIMDEKTYAPKQNEESDAEITAGRIEFKDVVFGYDEDNPVLKNINFTVEPGQTVALVGHTGSGKSSIINVLMRFYEFSSGQILIDGHDIRDYSTAELRSKLGLVLQEPFLFYGDIKTNIRMYDKSITDEQVKEAAEFVNASSFIEKLPQKYDSKVFERGGAFSAGQRQLLSFARTIVRDPKILILDEATANIDTQTEMMIQHGMNQMRKGRTTIAIAHRLSTIKDADLILVLDKGNIVERGNHESLLALNGRYAELYRMQSAQTQGQGA